MMQLTLGISVIVMLIPIILAIKDERKDKQSKWYKENR